MKTQKSILDYVYLVALIFAPAAILLYFWADLPDQIAVHFQFDGTPNRSDSKLSTLITLTLLNAFTMLIVTFAPKIDPKWQAKQYSKKTIGLIQLLVAGIMIAVVSFIVAANLDSGINIGSASTLLVAGIFMVLGNYMGKFKPNYFIGIRTPWTLESKEVWYKTHRLGGYVFFVGGLLILLASFVLPSSISSMFMLVLVLGISLIPIVYSYFIFQNLNANQGE